VLLAAGCGDTANDETHPAGRTASSSAPPVSDSLASVDACADVAAHFTGQDAVLRVAFQSNVATVTGWRIAGRFPEPVPQFLEGRLADEAIYACFLDMDIAAPCHEGCPGYNRGLYLRDSSGRWTLLVAGQHDMPGFAELPVVAPA
jgi:hypothetical protein